MHVLVHEIHIYVYLRVCVRTLLFLCVYVCACTCVCMYDSVGVCVSIYPYPFLHTHTPIHILDWPAMAGIRMTRWQISHSNRLSSKYQKVRCPCCTLAHFLLSLTENLWTYHKQVHSMDDFLQRCRMIFLASTNWFSRTLKSNPSCSPRLLLYRARGCSFATLWIPIPSVHTRASCATTRPAGYKTKYVSVLRVRFPKSRRQARRVGNVLLQEECARATPTCLIQMMAFGPIPPAPWNSLSCGRQMCRRRQFHVQRRVLLQYVRGNSIRILVVREQIKI